MDIDKALDTVGGYRPYHLTLFTLLGFSMFIPVCWQGLIIVFIGWEPPHYCRPFEGQSVNDSIPMVVGHDGVETLSKCLMYINITIDNETTECQNGWVYDNQGYYTIVEQWNLVCQYNYLSEVSQMLFQLGYLSSTLIFSFLTDKFGRKFVHIYTHLVICVLGIGLAFSTNYIMFIVIKISMGMCMTANCNSGLTYLMELFDSKRRAFAGIGLEMQWISCYLLLPLMAYYIQDWRIFQIVISSASAIWIIYFWILPESPLWLAAVGRYKEAEAVLRSMAHWNGVKLSSTTTLFEIVPLVSRPLVTDVSEQLIKPPIVHASAIYGGLHCSGSFINNSPGEDQIGDDLKLDEKFQGDHRSSTQKANTDYEKLDQKLKPISAKLLLTDRYLRLVLIISNLLWFANCLVYYGLILSTPSLAGNRFMNFFIMGLVEIPATFLAFYTTDKYGRRLSTSVYHFVAGIPLAIVIFVPHVTSSGTNLTPLIITLIMISKFGISGSFAVIVLYTKELFPTSLRGTGGGICQMLGNIGNIIAPFAGYLSKTNNLFWLPNVAFGAVSVIIAILVLLLPETAKKPLPQTVEDLHAMFHARTMEREKKRSKVKSIN